MADVIIVEATGYGGGKHGPALPLVQLAMAQAVAECMELGICDDTPAEIVHQRTGVMLDGSSYILGRKLAARKTVTDGHRGLVAAHQGAKAAELHNARDA